MQLTETEIRDVNRYLAEGKPLPDKYRFLLFEDKREVELVWNGKTSEVTNVVLPFQVIEQVDEPRAERPEDAMFQPGLFDFDTRGRQIKGWTNKLIWGDNKLILSSLKNGPLREEIEKQGGIKLIYIDPPFDVGADFSMDIEVGEETLTKEPSVLEQIAYRDTWGKGTDSFIAMIYERLSLMHDLLASTGSIFVHCDYRVSPFIRLILNEIFGHSNFVNEIVWRRKGGTALGAMNRLSVATDTIFWFSKADDFTINSVYAEAPEDYVDTQFRYKDCNCPGPLERGKDRMTRKGGLQRRQQRHPLFAQRGQIAANARKGLSPSQAAEAAGDFLLHLDHAKISLGQIIVKIHPQILEEVEDGFLLFAQAIEQIACITLFASPPLARGSRGPRVRLIPLIEQTEKLRFPIHDFLWLQTAFSQRARLVCRLFHIQQQAFEVGCPCEPLLCQKHEIAQQMHQTKRMLTIVQEVGAPAVVDRDPAEMRQDPDGAEGWLTPARIDVIVREGGRAGHMHPVPCSSHRESGFILMDHLALDQSLCNLLLHWGQLSRAPFDQLPDGAFTHLDSQQVPHHLTGTGQWQQLLFDQIHRCRSHMGSILDGGLHPGGKGGDSDLLARRTLFLLCLIFPHQQTRQGQIQHLSTLSSTRRNRLQVLLACFTPFDLQLGDLIGCGGEQQARSRVSCLPARFLLAGIAQAFGLASKAIRGGRQVAIVAIFGELVPQAFDLLAQVAHLLTVLLDHGVLLREQRLLLLDEFVSLRQLFAQLLILFSQRDPFFFNRHALTLLGLTPFGKSPADLGSYQRFRWP